MKIAKTTLKQLIQEEILNLNESGRSEAARRSRRRHERERLEQDDARATPEDESLFDRIFASDDAPGWFDDIVDPHRRRRRSRIPQGRRQSGWEDLHDSLRYLRDQAPGMFDRVAGWIKSVAKNLGYIPR